jgi:glycosyltransferase involved in cell wall biosynthesis
MGMYCPVIGSDIPAVREVCGDAVLYFDPYSLDDIKAKLIAFTQDSRLRAEYRLKGRNQVKAYTSSKAASRYAELINEIIRGHKQRV